MTELEFDSRLTARLDAYARAKTLPDDFTDRLVRASRRRRLVRRVRILAGVVVLMLASVFIVGACGPVSETRPHGTALVAADGGQGRSEKASGIFFLGLFRECFRRIRTMRKKEENEQ